MQWLRPLLLTLALAPAVAQASDMNARLAERAERPAEPAGERPAALNVIPPGLALFSFSYTDNAVAVRRIADVTADGRDEILVGIDQSNVSNIFLLDGASTGTADVVWSFMTQGGVSNGSPWGDQSLVAASDSDGNDAPNFLLGTAWGGRSAYAFDAFAGAELWRFDTYLNPPESGWVYSLAEMSDTNGDSVREVAFGAGSFSDSVYMVEGDSVGPATLLWRWQAPDAVGSVRNLGDVDGDGDDDVLIAVQDNGHQFVALDGSPPTVNGAVLWTYSTGTRSAFAVGVMPDITGDGISEAIGLVWTIDGTAVRCLNGATGQLVWQSTDVADYGQMVDVLPDVNGDSHDDLIVSTWENAVQVLDGVSGARIWKRSVGTLNSGDVWTARVAGDLNGDGFDDVVAGSFDTYVYAFSGVNGYPFWAYLTNRRLYSVHGLGDLNGDGVPEVVAGTQNLTGSSVPVLHVLDGDAGLTLPLFADDFENGAPVGWSFEAF